MSEGLPKAAGWTVIGFGSAMEDDVQNNVREAKVVACCPFGDCSSPRFSSGLRARTASADQRNPRARFTPE